VHSETGVEAVVWFKAGDKAAVFSEAEIKHGRRRWHRQQVVASMAIEEREH
jgi:hypothetical protein